MKGLNGKVSDLEKAAAQRKAKLEENSAFLQFNWKADVVESWIGECCPTQPGPSLSASPGQEDCSRAIARLFPKQLVFFYREEMDLMRAFQNKRLCPCDQEQGPPLCSALGRHQCQQNKNH